MSIPITRGIDHIGLTVADIDAAERFLIDGLGAVLVYEALNETMPPFKGAEFEKALGVPAGAEVNAIRMYRIGQGPGIELFRYTADAPRPALRACDRGWQHIALYVDDMEAAIERIGTAGGILLSAPWDLQGAESGPGNRFCFMTAPFGALIELVSYPSPQPYEASTPLRRWKPPVART
ncbi:MULTISPECIES: VOC family protein [unclassified Sphingopyxis]|uniref:VOC family protein n=1 Tax=unclassified Sphingopyxis TaxID=2614943 RepID=UPI00073658EE|nr:MULTISPECIES: VOC family protein [unclassified Sphingopyxis]KTE39311.1 glyoxalase [Sphingopyxis sp. HIX]KTE83304.1 glyoxalase [Sphingopyxis sp. HXXIV]